MYDNIVLTGSIAYDEIMDFPGKFVDYFHPDKLHQINISFVVNRLEKQLGGIATSIAYNLSLITDKQVRVLGAIGRDGEEFLNFFKSKHIDTSAILVDDKLYTAAGYGITDKKDNQIWGYYYGALEKGKKISLKKFTNLKALVIISANHFAPFLHFLDEAIRMKLDYMFDPGMTLTWISDRDLAKGVESCKWLVGNDYEIAQVLRRVKQTVHSLLKKNIAIITTLGEKGVLYQEKDLELRIPAFKVKKVIDPTGAGDAWRAGFVGGIIENKGVELSLKQANALASFAVEYYGTVNHRPKTKEIIDRINSLYVKT